MKKITAVLLSAIMIVICFSSCGKSEEIKAVEEKIKAIGEITLEKEQLIAEAEKAYTQLSEEDKKDVFFKELENARKNYEALKDYNHKANALLGVFDKIFAEYGISYSEIEKPYDELISGLPSADEPIRAEYDKIFSPVKEKYDAYNETAKLAVSSAATYVKGFMEVNEDTEIAVKNIGCIAQISDGTTYFLFSMTYNDGADADKNVYATARFAGTPAMETMLAYAESFYADAPTSEKTDGLAVGNIVLDVDEVLEAVKG